MRGWEHWLKHAASYHALRAFERLQAGAVSLEQAEEDAARYCAGEVSRAFPEAGAEAIQQAGEAARQKFTAGGWWGKP